MVCRDGSWDSAIVYRDGNVHGIWPYYIKSRMGINYLTMPMLTPYLGPWYIIPNEIKKNTSLYSYEKEVLSSLALKLPLASLQVHHAHPYLNNLLPLTWHGFSLNKRYTYRLDLNHPVEKLWEDIDSKQRNIIRKAESNLSIEYTDNLDDFYMLNKSSFERQGIKIPYTKNFLVELDAVLNEHNSRTILVAKDKMGILCGGVYLVHDRNDIYCLATGQVNQKSRPGSVSLILWHAIREFSRSHKVLDFEGGNIEAIEKFFRSFGGELKNYSRILKAKNPALECVFRLFKKI